MRPIAGLVLALLLLSSTRASADAWGGGPQPQAAAPSQGPPPGAPPPAPYPYGAPYGAQPYGAPPYGAQPYGAGPYGVNPQSLYLYESEKKTPAIAVLLSLLVPGVGNLYADHLAGAAITWALIIGGFFVVANGVHSTTQPDGFVTTQINSSEVTAGVLMLLSGIIYSPIDAYYASVDYNHALAQRLRLPTGLVLAPTTIRTERGVAWGPGLSLRF
jgi:hypothetical protein